MPKTLVCLLLLLLILPLSGCPKKSGQGKYTGPPRTKFYNIKVPLTDGSEFGFHRLYGRVALIDFFATSCAHCEVVQIPQLKKLHILHNKDGFEVVGIALQPQAKQFLQPFMQVLKLPYPVGIGGKQFTMGRTVLGYIRSIPRSYLVDRCGKIRRIYSGIIKKKELTRHVEALLKEKQNCPK